MHITAWNSSSRSRGTVHGITNRTAPSFV